MMARFLRKLGWTIARRRKETDLRDELAFHLAEETEARRAAGDTDGQARAAARRDFGSLALVAEDSRAAWGWPRLDQFAADLRYAVRTLWRTPTVTLAAVVTLALGIGMTTAIFTVVRGVLLRPLPFPDAQQLVALHTLVSTDSRGDRALSPPNFASIRDENRTFSHVAAFLESEHTLTGLGDARQVEGAVVSADFLDMLGVRPALGRLFAPDENVPGRERVVVLGYRFWQQQFNGDPSTIGASLMLDGIPHTVIGVAPAGAEFPADLAVWVPLSYGTSWSATATKGRNSNTWASVLGRRRPGTTIEGARAELRAIGSQLGARFPDSNTGVTFTARSLHDELVGDVRRPLVLLLGAVVLVLVIACANVTGLLLARAASRREEVAVRAALGAARGRIVCQLVTESLVLGLVGGLLGLALAYWATARLLAARPPGIPLIEAIRVDGIVLAFALIVTIAASVFAGLVPAVRASGEAMAGTLRTAGRGGLGSQRGQRLRRGLVVGQLAVAVVLLVGAGLFLRSFARLTTVDVGFRPEGLLSFRIDLPGASYPTRPSIQAFYDRLLERLERHPGVQAAGITFRRPPSGRLGSRFAIEARPHTGQDLSIGVQAVSPDYFRTMGIPIRRGRALTDGDGPGAPGAALINEAAVQQFFPNEDPIGRRLVTFSYDPVEYALAEFGDAVTIVGVVGDVRNSGLGQQARSEVYFSHAQVPLNRMFVVVRTAGDPAALTGDVRRHLAALDPNLALGELQTLEEAVADSVARPRYLTVLLTLLSGLALTLAAVGIFGLLSFAVAQRTHEIGVRIALGASPRALVGGIVREASRLVVIGLGLGLAGALALSRLLATHLFEISPTDPIAFAGVIAILAATALVASLVPAWRAAAVDPLVALRSD